MTHWCWGPAASLAWEQQLLSLCSQTRNIKHSQTGLSFYCQVLFSPFLFPITIAQFYFLLNPKGKAKYFYVSLTFFLRSKWKRSQQIRTNSLCHSFVTTAIKNMSICSIILFRSLWNKMTKIYILCNFSSWKSLKSLLIGNKIIFSGKICEKYRTYKIKCSYLL